MSAKRFYSRNKVVIILIAILLLMGVYYIYLHRHPRTDNAFVIANVRPVAAMVSGFITDIYVINQQEVKKGDKLFTIYKDPYALQVELVKNQLEAEKYSLQSLQEQLKIDEFNIEQQLAQFKNSKYLSDQAAWLANKEAVSQKDAEQAAAQKAQMEASLNAQKAAYQATKFKLQQEESSIRALEANLAIQQVNLDHCDIFATSDGIVSNMYISPGTYANEGAPLFSFIDTTEWWIQANLKETELSNVREGQKVWIKLWIYPGKIFEGEITKVGWNVNRQETSMTNFLAEVEKENEWFLLPQRFPVQVKITDKDISKYPLHVGSSATVIIDTKDDIFRQIFWQIDLW